MCIARDMETIRLGLVGCQGEAFYQERIEMYRSDLRKSEETAPCSK